MRFSFAEAMIDPSFYVPLARAAEEAGFDTMLVGDAIAYPAQSSSRYPYTADGTREFLEDKPFVEPFVLLGALTAVTTRLRFMTNVLKLPVRAPALVAKQATSLAVLSGDRVQLGVGLSPWPEDYELCGVPWAGRGRRMDEAIAILRGFATGGWFAHHGQTFDLPTAKMCPAPGTPVPIIVGGHGDAALRRAARIGDGWILAGAAEHDELARLVGRLDELRGEFGRDDVPFQVHAGSTAAFSVDGVRRLEDLGVTDVSVGFRDPYTRGPDTQPLEEKVRHLHKYADKVISKLRG